MRITLVALALSALLDAGCHRGTYILVSFEAPTTLTADALEITATNAGQDSHARLERQISFATAQSLSLTVGQERTGEMTVEVIAKRAGQEVARGKSTTTIVPHGVANLTIALGGGAVDMTAPADQSPPPDLQMPPDLAPPSLWTHIDVGTVADLNGVWMSGDTILAVGDAVMGPARGIATRSDDGGKTWTASTISTPQLFAAWGTAPNHVFAIGHDGIALENTGSGWAKFLFGSGTDLVAMGGPADELYVAASDANGAGGTVLASSSAFRMSVIPSNPSASLLTALAAEKGNVFVVDSQGTIFNSTNLGAKWIAIGGGAKKGIAGGWIRSGDVFFVGAAGAIYYRPAGQLISPMISGVATDLAAIWCGAKDCFAVGAAGTILHLANNGWQSEAVPSVANLRAVFGDGRVVYAVGRSGEVLRRAIN